MKDISINHTIGNEPKQLKIEFLTNGTGHLMINKYYHGQVVFALGQWRVFLPDKSALNNSDDIQALVQILSDRI